MTQPPRFSHQPNPLVWWLGALALGIMTLACLQALPGVDGVRLLIRSTARTSLLFFLLAYTAQAIGTPPLRIALSLATSLQRPSTQVQKAALDLVRRTSVAVFQSH